MSQDQKILITKSVILLAVLFFVAVILRVIVFFALKGSFENVNAFVN
jgi:hypothetical protein